MSGTENEKAASFNCILCVAIGMPGMNPDWAVSQSKG